MPIPEELDPIHADDWQTSLEKYKVEEEERKRAIANQVKVPPPRSDVKPSDFTRRGEEDDEGAIAAMTRLGEPSVTTIFLQQTKAGLVFPNSRDSVDLKARPNLALIRNLLAHSTRLSKKGLVQALLSQENPPKWTSALLRNCRYVELNAQGVAVVGDWRLTLDPLRGVLIEKAE